MAEQLTFHLPTVEVLLPDKPPKAKKPFPNLPKECALCGSKIVGKGFKRGDLCGRCKPERAPLAAGVMARICCAQWPKAERPLPCLPGECRAIPW